MKKYIILMGLVAFSLLAGCIKVQRTSPLPEQGVQQWEFYRDLFTPMYNDSVTVEPAGYDGGWLFWVNHSRTLSSYYFPNQKDYLIRIETIDGEIELIR